MALPADYNVIQVRGKYVYLDGSGASGSVKFTGKTVTVSTANDTIIVPTTITVNLVAGAFTVNLPATDDPDITPTGWTYEVTEMLSGGGGRTYDIAVPISALSTGIDLSDVAPAVPSSGDTTTYVTLTAFNPVKDTANTALTRAREGPLSLKDERIGALLDGSNEAAKLTTAMSMLPASGGHIWVPPGQLGIGSEVTLLDNVTLSGVHGASVVRPSTGYTGRLISTGGSNRITSLKFDGLGTSGTLLTVRKARSMFQSLHFANSGSNGMEFAGTAANSSAHANKITDTFFESCTAGYAIFLNTWCYDNEFLNTWIGGCQVGLRIQDGACFFNTLHVWGCTGNGVEVRANSTLMQNVFLETNGAGGTGNGIDIFNATDTQIVGGRLWKNASNGANLGGTSSRTRLSNLSIHENQANGINAGSVNLCQVTGNTFYDTATPSRQDRPIVTSGTSDFWIITGNIMRAADHVVGGKSLVGANNVVANNIE